MLEAADQRSSNVFMAELFGAVAGATGTCDVILRSTFKIIAYASEVKDATADQQRIALELENLQAITAAFQGFLRSNAVTKKGFADSAPITTALQHCQAYTKTLEDKFEATRTKGRLLWPLKSKTEIQKVLQDIARFTNLLHWALSINGWSLFCNEQGNSAESLKKALDSGIERIVQMIGPVSDNTGNTTDIQAYFNGIESALEATQQTIAKISDVGIKNKNILEHIENAMDSDASSSERKEFLEWLAPNEIWDKHRHVCSTRQEGTGTWILQAAEYFDWRDNPASGTLWCHGIPGCGKTVLFSCMLENLLAFAPRQKGAVAAVYFDYKDDAKQDPTTIMMYIIRQLCETLY